MCCCFVEDVGVHAQTLDTQPSRAPGSSVPSAPFLRHPRPATPGRQQRGGSSTSLCFPPGHTQPSAARPASRSPHRPPLPGASRLPRSLQPLRSLGSPRWHVTSSRKPPNDPSRGPLALPAAARLCSPQMPLLRAFLDAVPVHAGNQGRASGSARRRPAHFLPTAGPWRPPRRTERPARGAGGRQRGAAHGPEGGRGPRRASARFPKPAGGEGRRGQRPGCPAPRQHPPRPAEPGVADAAAGRGAFSALFFLFSQMAQANYSHLCNPYTSAGFFQNVRKQMITSAFVAV